MNNEESNPWQLQISLLVHRHATVGSILQLITSNSNPKVVR